MDDRGDSGKVIQKGGKNTTQERNTSKDGPNEDVCILIKVKKGENRAYVQYKTYNDGQLFMDDRDRNFAGPVSLSSSILHLMEERESIKAMSKAEALEALKRQREEEHRGKRIPNVGFNELIASARKSKKRKASIRDESHKIASPSEVRQWSQPSAQWGNRFELGQRVLYYSELFGEIRWHPAHVVGFSYPGEGHHHEDETQVLYRLQPDDRNGSTFIVVERLEREIRCKSWGQTCLVGCLSKRKDPLLPLDRVGIDTCSALSVSSSRKDFLWLDESKEAKKSVILRGVGGESARIGGRGPMVVEAIDDEGNRIIIFDPSAVYLKDAVNQADFRIFGQQRLKNFGFRLQQQEETDGGDILNYNNGLKIIPLQTHGGILTLKTVPRSLSGKQQASLEIEIEGALQGKDHQDYCLQVEIQTSLLMNEAYLTKEEVERLNHWRTAHRSQGKGTLNEDCPVCVESKKKVGTFKRNYEFVGHTKGHVQPYWRLYCDGYGGQSSMGDMSYQGGKGGFVFACPTGSIKTKLYGSTDQFPSCLFQVLQEIETEGYITREVYVDTHSVNLSKATEEVAAMFRVKIIPVSAGTPQEMAYAESAVRVMGQMGRTLMCGAPHLPQFCWGLADLYATYIHDLMPQHKLKCSPYEFRTGREPDLDRFFVRVFGAPCQYSPMGESITRGLLKRNGDGS